MDPEDFLEQPYNFGECWSIETTAPAYCNAWKNRSREIKVLIRKEGDYTHVHFPKALFSSREGINTDKCKVIVDLYYPLAEKDSMFYISKCRSRNFVGSMQVYDHFAIKDKIVQARIDYDRNWGTLTFKPINNKIYESDQITLSKNVYDIGILDTTIIIDEEPEDTIVDADEDDTMGERDPTISVFPDDINNEEYDEDGIPEGWIKEKVKIFPSCKNFDWPVTETKTAIFAKNKEGTKGIIIFPPIMSMIGRESSYTPRLFAIPIEHAYRTFFQWIPSGFLKNDGEIIVYEPHKWHSSVNYKKKKVKIYYDDSYDNTYTFYLGPDDDNEYYQLTYGLTTPLVKPREIGLTRKWKVEFDIPSNKPTYKRELPNIAFFDDPSVLPSITGDFNRTLPVKAHMHVWDSYVSGEAECKFHIEIEEIFTATITMKNLLAPLKKTASLQSNALHINIEDFLDFYGGDIGGIEGEGKVKAYNPSTKTVEEMVAKVTCEKNIFTVVPDNDFVKNFFTEDIDITEDVGLLELKIYGHIAPNNVAA